jgi:di/tricarboxylate transporter
MSFDQVAILVLLGGMLVVFAVDRWRMELVALAGLGLGFALGLVPADEVFAGFADPAVVTVVEILLIVQVLSRVALLDRLAARIVSARLGERATIAILCLIAAAISVFMNNIGALALMLPVIYGICAATGIAPSRVLMPVSFSTLLGGICSEIGTPANLVANSQLVAATGRHFSLFDFAWAGIPVALAGLVAILLFTPGRLAGARPDTQAESEKRPLVLAAKVPAGSAFAGRPLQELPFAVHSLVRGGAHVFLAAGQARLAPDDVLLLQAPADVVVGLLQSNDLTIGSGRAKMLPSKRAVVMPESTVVGSRVGNLSAFASRDVEVAAVSPRTSRIEGAFDDLQLSIGDIVYLDGPPEHIADALAETEMLAVGDARPNHPPVSNLSLLVFAVGVAAAATSLVSPQIAFGAVALALAAAGALDLRVAIGALNWPILIMLAAMISLGTAIETTGAAQVIAGSLVALSGGTAIPLVAAMLMLALAVTPFVNNASTMIVLGPVAIDAARVAGIAPEPLLIAVAMGASIDFLTPFGHHNNTLVMGLGNYRFIDFLRAGWLIAVAAAATGVMFTSLVWIH